jgi:heat-inducible transcriptional repressor
MGKAALDARRQQVLESVIQLHIETGEPVGSESVARFLGRTLSPASIRNTMAELEKLGLLDHPHTSAGRAPTDEGYRVYVDGLLEQRSLPTLDTAAIASELRSAEGPPTQVLERASHVLSELSHQVGFVVVPDLATSRLRHIDFVRLTPPRVLVVLVSQSGLVSNKMVELDEEIGQEELQACANYLNAHFSGMPLAAIHRRLIELMREDKALYDTLIQRVVALGQRALERSQDDTGAVYLDGTANMLDQPRLEDAGRMRELFRTFEEKSRLVRILTACISGGGVRILIGHENPEPSLQGLAVVAVGTPLEGDAPWGLGVLGSTRMEYGRVIAIVDHVARAVAQALEEIRA